MAFSWMPEVRPDVERRMTTAMKQEQLGRSIDWDRRHAEITHDQAVIAPRQSKAAQRARHCWERNFCFCSEARLSQGLFLDSWRA
eukprot:5439527-Lingulodinium_polyedra.AAC.1